LRGLIVLALLAMTMFITFPMSSATPKAAVQQCLWYKRMRHYTDTTYTNWCGTTTYLCDGSVAHAGCWTAFSTVTTCDCIEE
jgi:hypothetical protein